MHCIDDMSHVVFFYHKPIWIAALMSNVAKKILHSFTGRLGIREINDLDQTKKTTKSPHFVGKPSPCFFFSGASPISIRSPLCRLLPGVVGAFPTFVPKLTSGAFAPPWRVEPAKGTKKPWTSQPDPKKWVVSKKNQGVVFVRRKPFRQGGDTLYVQYIKTSFGIMGDIKNEWGELFKTLKFQKSLMSWVVLFKSYFLYITLMLHVEHICMPNLYKFQHHCNGWLVEPTKIPRRMGRLQFTTKITTKDSQELNPTKIQW